MNNTFTCLVISIKKKKTPIPMRSSLEIKKKRSLQLLSLCMQNTFVSFLIKASTHGCASSSYYVE